MPPGRLVLKRCGGKSRKNTQCPQLLDPFGDHQTSCKFGRWSATSRHHYVTEAIARSLTGLPGIQGHTEVIIDNRAGRTCENRAEIPIFEGLSGLQTARTLPRRRCCLFPWACPSSQRERWPELSAARERNMIQPLYPTASALTPAPALPPPGLRLPGDTQAERLSDLQGSLPAHCHAA